jgi:hypothetical protein
MGSSPGEMSLDNVNLWRCRPTSEEAPSENCLIRTGART